MNVVFTKVESFGSEDFEQCILKIYSCVFSLCFSPQAGPWVQSHILCFWQISCCYVDMVGHVLMYTFNSLLYLSTLGQRLQQEYSSSDLFSLPLLTFYGLPDWSSRFWTNICCISIYTATSFPVYCHTGTGKVFSVVQYNAMLSLVIIITMKYC